MTRYAKLLTDDRYQEHATFWKAQLSRLEDAFHFRQTWRSCALADEGEIDITVALDGEKHRFVTDWVGGNDLAAFVIVLAAVQHALHLYTGAATVSIATPLLRAGSCGDFDGAVPLVAAIDQTLTVQRYLDQIRQAVADSYTYQDFPLSAVWETLLKRNTPLTPNILVWLPAIHDRPENATAYDLVAEIQLSPKRQIVLRGKSSAFAKPFLENLGRHIGNLLSGYRDLGKSLADVSAIDEAERDRLLQAASPARREWPVDQTIAQWFYARAAAAPDHPALKTRARTMTYRELNEASNRLAWFLREQMGVQPGEVVGLCYERSELSIIGLLAILKAGAVYLPLDIEYPDERLRFMIEDAGVRALLIHSDHFARLMDFNTIPMAALDLQLPALETSPADLPPLIATDQPAYIIYTSGSTGQPKGVVVEHRSFVNTALHHINAFAVGPGDALSQFYAASFDSSLFEIFVALLSGATLVMIEKAAISDPEQFANVIESHNVTMLTIPPIYLAMLDKSKLASVTKIVSAGDNPRLDDAQALAQTRCYYNSYGPTEASVCVTHYQLDTGLRYGSRLPIGKPISNVSIYVLDDQLRLTPEGCIGEICIGGVALARGYLNRDDLTAQAFVASPFVAGERLYRTGDLGVCLPDGDLEMIGRKDSQVKIRGYRIELGEVELALAGHTGVKEAVALAREDKPGDKRLVAYVTLAGPATAAELRDYLKERLPEFMTPSVFVVMAEMPMTANGKIDRKALPAPQAAQESGLREAPQTEAQRQLVEIWKEVLGVSEIGVEDNFFELGGDSILIIQMVSQAARCGLKFTPQQVFEHQTIAALAEVAERAEFFAAEQGPISGPMMMLPMQEWFFLQNLEERHHFNQSVMLAVPADVDPARLESSLQNVLAQHDALRSRFTFAGGQWAQEIVPEEQPIPFSIVDLSGLTASGQQAELEQAAARLQASLDLANGPLLRVQFFCLNADEARLLFVIHHLVVDGVSWRILLEDFYTAYQQQLRGEAMQLPPKTTSVREWGHRLKAFAADLNGEMDYWADEARRRIQKIPRDLADGANTTGSADEVEILLSADETQALLHEAPRAYNTQINDILLTALALTLKEWSGPNKLEDKSEDELLVDLEAHGREDLFAGIDLSRTVGWLTAVYPALLRVEGRNLGESLVAIKEQIRRIPRHGIGYGVLRYLGDDGQRRTLASLPSAEIVFNYLGQTDRVLSVGAGWRPLPGANGGERTSKGQRSHVLEITSIVMAGQLRISWEYSRNLHHRQTIERLAQLCAEHLRGLIRHCCSGHAAGYTPSDFPAARIDQKTLDALMSRINRQ